MAYPIANGSVAQVALIGKHENQQVMSVFHYRLSAGETIDDGKAALDALWFELASDDRLVDAWRKALSVKVVAVRGQVQWIAPTRFAYIPKTIAEGTGNVAGDAMPVNTSVAITRRTEFSGRHHVSTLHMPGVPATFIVNGNVTPTAEPFYQEVGEESLAVVTTAAPAAEWFPIPFNRVAPELAQQLMTYSIQPTARVERRRTVGLGS